MVDLRQQGRKRSGNGHGEVRLGWGAHPLYSLDERRPVVFVGVDPVDVGAVGQSLSHVGKAAHAGCPV